MATEKTSALVPPADLRRRYAEVLQPAEAAALEFLFVLRETAHRVDTLLAGWLGQDALTPGRLQVMAILWSKEEPCPQSEIVAILKVSRANVSMLVDGLRREGHVTAAADPADARRTFVTLTKTGRATTERLIKETAVALRGSLALDSDQLRRAAELMQRALR